MNGADRLCDALLADGVDVCFANAGTSEMHFVAALDRKPAMRCVLGLFEGVVTGAADGYARMTRRPAAALLHTGPGLANGLANLHNARRARSPIINVVGDHASYHLQFDAPLTSDIEGLARPMSDWVRRVESADTVGAVIGDAYAAACSLPGVATVILSADSAWNPVHAAPLPPVDLSPRMKGEERTECLGAHARQSTASLGRFPQSYRRRDALTRFPASIFCGKRYTVNGRRRA
jgi:acetolactate synthase-1/2/3 large subunit